MSPVPDLNVPLLRQTMTHIETHPDEWNQKYWAARTPCGTVACFAGTTLVLAGHTIAWFNGGDYAASVRLKDGRLLRIDEAAQDELGLTYEQAQALFYEGNTLKELRELVDRFIADAQAVP